MGFSCKEGVFSMKFKTWDINLKVRLFGEALLDISFWAVFPFLTIYFSDSIGRQTTSLLLILSQALSVITALLGGYFADTYGRKRMMSISVIGEGAGFLIFAIAATTIFHSPYVAFFWIYGCEYFYVILPTSESSDDCGCCETRAPESCVLHFLHDD
ncbi:putative multidrug resistance protein, integral membrane protein [Listeria cornellensis FSL F6-0969]|uniref:Putative multidrug resistance protein, integral membrane protein n=1 Tax=Listeria cornellensis FSL F6-0969 TaxID=1265820 RepID=W7BIH6_9LIST|nr:putative multidrug resistance protein, integral membrane protein [Listeria cornellensis FSL F6-0969]